MTQPHPGSSPAPIPDWAVQQATEDLYDVDDSEAITERARRRQGVRASGVVSTKE